MEFKIMWSNKQSKPLYIVLCCSLVVGCATPEQNQQMFGAAGGAALGCLAGALISGNAKGCAAAIADFRAIHAYPDFDFENADVVSSTEDSATNSWLRGLVKEGHLAAKITMPVLVGDGSQDAILPMPDSANVAKAVPHAALKLYRDAGHGFLFQHVADWSRLVLHFLTNG